MKLEVGMYVKSKINGMIGKITDIEETKVFDRYSTVIREETRYILDNNSNRGFCETEKDSVKASHNIIDLIEVGDVLIDKEGHKYSINYNFETDYNNEYQSYEITIDDHITLFIKDGLSIVTKEQFEAIKYEVK